MTDTLTLLATATDERLARFADMMFLSINWTNRRKQTWVLTLDDNRLSDLIEAATACAVTLQRVHDPGREERYETLWQGPMEGWANKGDDR